MADAKISTFSFSGGLFASLVGMILTFMFTFVHGHRMYHDIYTKERKSVLAGSKKPELSNLYKILGFFTMGSIICSFNFSLIHIVSLFTSVNITMCKLWVTWYMWSFTLAKAFFYWVLVLRLDYVYGGSNFGYSKKLINALLTYSVIMILFCIGSISYAIYGESNKYLVSYTKIGDFQSCALVSPGYAATAYAILDFSLNIIYVVLFSLPLKKLLAQIDDNEDKIKEMLLIGVKVKILTFFAAFSTLFNLFFGVLTNTWLSGIDLSINCVCLMYMTRYYNDKYHFKPVCKLCIYLCQGKSGKKANILSDDLIDNGTTGVTYGDKIDDVGSVGSVSGSRQLSVDSK